MHEYYFPDYVVPSGVPVVTEFGGMIHFVAIREGLECMKCGFSTSIPDWLQMVEHCETSH